MAILVRQGGVGNWRAGRRPPRLKKAPRNIKIGKMIGKLGNLLMFLAVVWLLQRPACLANWQTQFFPSHKSHCPDGLVEKLSLPLVANSVANWQSHIWQARRAPHKNWPLSTRMQFGPAFFLRAIPAARPKGVDFPGDFLDEFRAGSHLHGG